MERAIGEATRVAGAVYVAQMDAAMGRGAGYVAAHGAATDACEAAALGVLAAVTDDEEKAAEVALVVALRIAADFGARRLMLPDVA